MKIKLIVFDFDGTLVDTSEDLAEAMNTSLRKMGLKPVSRNKVWGYTGDGTPLLIKRILRDEGHHELYKELFNLFLNYYEEHYMDFAHPMDGVEETLKHLKNVKMAVLSNKYRRFVVKLLNEFGLKDYFFAIYGKDSFEKSKPDPYPLLKIMENAGVAREETIFVGDSKNDILISNNVKVKCFIVPSGVTPVEDMLKLNPFKILNNFTELEKYIK